MSWFGGKEEVPAGPSGLDMARIDYVVINDLFTRMHQECNSKCITKHNQPDMDVGEMTCIDRCAQKYLKAFEVVGTTANAFEQTRRQQLGLEPMDFGNNNSS